MRSSTLSPFFLFGSTKPWIPPPWDTVDDRVRGGASRSNLSALPNNCVHFHGHLDISILGGAGFASQFSPPEAVSNRQGMEEKDGQDGAWDLSGYDGVEVEVGKADEKIFTLILKDEATTDKREDVREKAGVNWEYDFRIGGVTGKAKGKEGEGGREIVWVPWSGFKATYRGKEKEDAGELKKGGVRSVGFMMRSYFGKQEGDFSIELRSVCARKATTEEEMEASR